MTECLNYCTLHMYLTKYTFILIQLINKLNIILVRHTCTLYITVKGEYTVGIILLRIIININSMIIIYRLSLCVKSCYNFLILLHEYTVHPHRSQRSFLLIFIAAEAKIPPRQVWWKRRFFYRFPCSFLNSLLPVQMLL